MTPSKPKPKNTLRPTGKRPGPATPQTSTQAATLDLAPTIEALGLVLEMDRPADVKLSGFFRNYPKLGSRDRAFIAEAVYGVLRHLRSLQVLAAPPTPRRLLLAWLARHGGRNLREFEALAHKDDLEWLRGLKGAKLDDQPEAVRLDLPDWLHERLRAQFGEHLPDLMAALNSPAPLDLRVNTIKADRDDLLAALARDGIARDSHALLALGAAPARQAGPAKTSAFPGR
jgi:16S rRNA (cytosine967-C5)-methyltransferase